MSQEELVEIVREWIHLDNEIEELNEKIKQKRNLKKIVNTKLIEIMKMKNLDSLNIKDGSLMFKKTTTKKAISQESLTKSLSIYFNGNQQIKPEEITKFIYENREQQTTEEIKRKKDNSS